MTAPLLVAVSNAAVRRQTNEKATLMFLSTGDVLDFWMACVGIL
jgi:hypothetical protein